MTTLAPARITTARHPELWLMATLLAYVVYIAVAAATLATKAESSSAELTAAQVSGMGATWMVVHLLWMAPPVLAALGLRGLAARDDLDAGVLRWVVPATLLVAVRLAQRRRIARTARVVAVLTGLYLVWEVATYVAIAVGSATLIDTVGPPPFVLGLLWAVLGAHLLWSKRSGKDVR